MALGAKDDCRKWAFRRVVHPPAWGPSNQSPSQTHPILCAMLSASKPLLTALGRSTESVAHKPLVKRRSFAGTQKPLSWTPRRGLFHYNLKSLEENERITTHHVAEKREASTEAKKADTRGSLKLPFEALSSTLSTKSTTSAKPNYDTRFTRLANGVTVASEDTYAQMTSVGLYANIGSRFEAPTETGMAQVVERLMFRATSNNTHAEVVGKLEHMGVTATSATHPDMLELRGEVLRDSVEPFLSLVSDSIICPVFTNEEVSEQVDLILEETENKRESAHTLLTDAMHRIAFAGTPLANTTPSESLHTISAEQVTQYMRRHFTGPRFVLSAASIDHDELVSLARKYFSRLPSAPTDGSISPVTGAGMPLIGSFRAQYSGGIELFPREIDPEDPDPVSTLAVVFKGTPITDPNVHIMFTLSQLLGGGDSFSSGGPGKGIHSQLYRNVLYRHHFISHCSSFVHSYADASLFGIMADCSPSRIADALDVICAEFTRTAAQLDEESVQRAKNALKSQIFYNLESRSVISDDIARYALAFGRRYSPQEICDGIDAITVESLQMFARAMLSTPPVVVAVGPQSALKRVPKYASFERYFERVSGL